MTARHKLVPTTTTLTRDEFHDLAEVADRLRTVRAIRARHRLLALLVILTSASALWTSRHDWLALVTSADPFQATPAENFPSGAAGVALPTAKAVDGMSAAKVSDALARVKRALELSYLDDRMLVGHDPGPLLAMLAPDSAGTVRSMFDNGQYGTAMVRLAPGSTLAAAPRVSGRIRYARVDWRGTPALDVTTNYVWAYAFAVPAGVVVLHTQTHWMFPMATDLRPSSRGMYLGGTTGYWHGMSCTDSLRGLTAPAASDEKAAPATTGQDPVDAYFDPHHPVRVGGGCR